MRAPLASLALFIAATGCGGITTASSKDAGASTDASSIPVMGGSSSGSSSGGSSGSSSGGFGGSSGSSGGPTGSSSGGGDDAGEDLDGGPPSSGPDCGAIPTLRPDNPGDIFCLGTGASGLTCSTGTECCANASYADNSCSAWNQQGQGCTSSAGNAIGVACNGISDCVANGVSGSLACCLQGAIVAPMAGCGYLRARNGTAIACETWGAGDGGVVAGTCAAGETQVCQRQTDCPTGTTCTPGKWGSFQIGFCM
jgi:hypothetical protein